MDNATRLSMLRELHDLMEKYDVSIGFTCSSCSDTYGLSDDRLVITEEKGGQIVHDFDSWHAVFEKKDLEGEHPRDVLGNRALLQMQKCVDMGSSDPEASHANADRILCGLLVELGLGDVVAKFDEVEKWYA